MSSLLFAPSALATRREAPRPPHPDQDQGSEPTRISPGRRARPRVLIVEDDDDQRELYTWCLTAAGWLVRAVPNGAEALFVAVQFEPDVIVMDLCLPFVGGLDAARQLKHDVATKHIPVVACTAFDHQTSEIEAMDAGCDRFLSKPFEPEELRELLKTMVKRRGGPRSQ